MENDDNKHRHNYDFHISSCWYTIQVATFFNTLHEQTIQTIALVYVSRLSNVNLDYGVVLIRDGMGDISFFYRDIKWDFLSLSILMQETSQAYWKFFTSIYCMRFCVKSQTTASDRWFQLRKELG